MIKLHSNRKQTSRPGETDQHCLPDMRQPQLSVLVCSFCHHQFLQTFHVWQAHFARRQAKMFFIQIKNIFACRQEKNNAACSVLAQAKQMIRQRDYLRAKANKTDSNILRQAYNHIRNKVNSTLRKLRKKYYTNRIQINEGNLKNTWKVLKEALGQNDKTCSIDKIVVDDTNQTDKAKIADAFNNDFVSIGEKIANSIEGCNESPTANIQRVLTKFEFQQITTAHIKKSCSKTCQWESYRYT